jgi:hypothetical protein
LSKSACQEGEKWKKKARPEAGARRRKTVARDQRTWIRALMRALCCFFAAFFLEARKKKKEEETLAKPSFENHHLLLLVIRQVLGNGRGGLVVLVQKLDERVDRLSLGERCRHSV